MCSGFEVLVDSCHVQHHVLPIGPFSPHHFINVQCGFDSNALSCLEGQGEVPSLILAIQLLIWDVGWKVCVQESTKGQPVIPAAAEVCDVDILVAFCFLLTPLQQGVPL